MVNKVGARSFVWVVMLLLLFYGGDVQASTPPKAFFMITPGENEVNVLPIDRFLLDASLSTDTMDPEERVLVRWDWENDGIWDTDFLDCMYYEYQFPREGVYTVKLEVKDQRGVTSTTSKQITVRESLPLEYEKSAPVRIQGYRGTAESPLVIEGKEISSADTTGIEIRDSEHVIIRNNYIHHCGDKETGKDVYAVFINNSNHVTIEGNLFEDNYIGVEIHNSRDIEIAYNDQVNTYKRSVFAFRKCSHVSVHHNFGRDNGATESLGGQYGYMSTGSPLQGTVLWQTSHGRIYNNVFINSSSDGIGLAGAVREEPHTRSYDFDVFHNKLYFNGEQGIWLEGAQQARIHNNYIAYNRPRPGLEEGSSSNGICLEFDVQQCDIYNNTLIHNSGCGIVVRNSPDNHIHDNFLKSFHGNAGIWIHGSVLGLPEYHVVGSRDNIIDTNVYNDKRGSVVQLVEGPIDHSRITDNKFFGFNAIHVRDEGLLNNIIVEGNTNMRECKDPPIHIKVDGYSIKTDTPPAKVNGRVLVPLRAIFQALGAEVEWEPMTSSVTATKDGNRVYLQVGNHEVQINGTTIYIDVPPGIVGGRTLVPVRVVAEAFSKRVEWDSIAHDVWIKD